MSQNLTEQLEAIVNPRGVYTDGGTITTVTITEVNPNEVERADSADSSASTGLRETYRNHLAYLTSLGETGIPTWNDVAWASFHTACDTVRSLASDVGTAAHVLTIGGGLCVGVGLLASLMQELADGGDASRWIKQCGAVRSTFRRAIFGEEDYVEV